MYITLDIGGTNMRIAATDSKKAPSFERLSKISITNNYSKDMGDICRAIRALSADKPLQGIGLSIAGDINTQEGYVNAVDYFTDWVHKPLASDLTKEFDCDVQIQNDAASAGLGEAVYGKGRNQDFLFLVWGSGFGGTDISHIHGHTVAHPFDPGHQIIHQNGLLCVCGQKGCLQAYVGGKEVRKIYGKEANELSGENWSAILEDISQGLMNLVAIRPTKLIIFGGGVAINQPDKIEQLNDLLRSKLTIPANQIPDIELTSFGDNTALYGALALLR